MKRRKRGCAWIRLSFVVRVDLGYERLASILIMRSPRLLVMLGFACADTSPDQHTASARNAPVLKCVQAQSDVVPTSAGRELPDQVPEV